MFIEINQQPLNIQKQIIEERLKNWQNEIEQIDDITILCLKWKI